MSDTYEQLPLERLKTEAERWIAGVATNGSMSGAAANGIRDIVQRAHDLGAIRTPPLDRGEIIEALHELVTLKALKDSLDALEPTKLGESLYQRRLADYQRRKPLAWKRAREVLAMKDAAPTVAAGVRLPIKSIFAGAQGLEEYDLHDADGVLLGTVYEWRTAVMIVHAVNNAQFPGISEDKGQ